MKIKLKGCCMDNAILAIAKFVLNHENNVEEAIEEYVEYLIKKYKFVSESEYLGLKKDILNMIRYEKNKQTKYLSANKYAKFKLDSFMNEEGLIIELQNLQLIEN